MLKYSVYMLISNYKNRIISYVGYTNDLKSRLSLHNTSKGAKFTRGKKWRVIYKEVYSSKSKALSREYELKKDRIFRNKIKQDFVKDQEIKKLN